MAEAFSLDDLKSRMHKSVLSLKDELAGLRTGRASPSLLETKHLEAMCEVLRGYDWPGNVRELENFIDRLVVILEGRVPSPGALRRQVEELIATSLAERRSAVRPTAQAAAAATAVADVHGTVGDEIRKLSTTMTRPTWASIGPALLIQRRAGERSVLTSRNNDAVSVAPAGGRMMATGRGMLPVTNATTASMTDARPMPVPSIRALRRPNRGYDSITRSAMSIIVSRYEVFSVESVKLYP